MPILWLALVQGACGGSAPSTTGQCGATTGEVIRVIDGDTLQIETGDTVRLLLVDAPELGDEPECFAAEAAAFLRAAVLGRVVHLSNDVVCRDAYGRLLAYVTTDELNVNLAAVERGFACVLHVPPNGAAHLDEFTEAQDLAVRRRAGLWGACSQPPC